MGAVTTIEAISGAGKVNDGGGVLHAGTVDGTNVTFSQDFDIFAGVEQRDPATVFPDGTHLTMTRSLSNGTIGQLTESEYMIPTIATSLAGVSTTAFSFSGADYGSRRSIHWKERARFGYVESWNPFTGTGSGVSANYLYHDIDSNGEGAIDQAAHPTRPIPGLLAMFEAGPAIDSVPTLTTYPAKLNG